MSQFDPLDSDARKAFLPAHPLVTNYFTTLTPSMPEVLTIVLDAVMLYKKSICFNALPQMGKTKICRFCKTALAALSEYGDREVMLVSVDPTKRESVVRNMATTLGLYSKGIFRLESKRQEVLDLIEGRLRQKKGRHFVLFIDEIQALKFEDFENLQYLQNALSLRDIAMTVISFAQTQIENVVTSLRAQGRPELIVRFLNEMYDLPRCKDESWIRSTIATFDNDLIFPIDSSCSFTQFFLPQAFNSGFRLANYAHEIFGALEKAAADCILPAIPTVHILDTFRYALIRSRHDDGSEFTLSSAIINSAVVESQISNYANSLKNPGVANEPRN